MDGALFGIRCPLPPDTEIQTDWASNNFMKTVLEEDIRVKELRAQEIQLTKENPRIKELNELAEISQELRDLKREQFLDEKRRQQIRQNNYDLRQLEIQIRAAYSRKQLDDQKLLADNSKKNALMIKQKEDAQLNKERLCAEEALRKKEIQERQKKVEFRNVLLGQMQENRERLLKYHGEVMQDRENMQKVNRQLEAERLAEQMAYVKRKEDLKHEMNDYIKQRDILKQFQRTEKANENDRFLEVMRKRDEEKKQRMEKRRLAREKKEALSEKIGQQLFEIKTEQRRREDLLLDLLVEERKAKDDFRYRQNLEKQLDDRLQIRLELQRYREEILELKKQESKEEEAQFQREQMRIMAERDKVDQLTVQRRRQKMQDYKLAIQDMILDKQRQRAEETAEKMRDYEYLLQQERKLQEEAEDERIRMLRSQPPEILRYLPAGVFHPNDRELLQEDNAATACK